MGKVLTSEMKSKLESNSAQMKQQGMSDDDIQKMAYKFVEKFGVDENELKKKGQSQELPSQKVPTPQAQPTPSKSSGKSNVLPNETKPFSLLESSPSLTGGILEDYNAKVKEQERLKKEETDKKLGSLNIDFSSLDAKVIGNEIKRKLKDATIGEIEAFNEVISENTKNKGTSYLGFRQSSIGKANELISNVKNGIELSQEDEAYLKQTSPKAYNELLSSSNVISVDVNSIARQNKKIQQELFSFSANQDMVKSANDLRQLGIDVNNISANKAVQELAKVESVYSAKLNELNTKYPEKLSGYTGSKFKDNYNPIVKRDDAYAEEKAELDAQYNGVKERIGKLNAYQYALKNKNASVESVGEEVLKVADPIRYNNFVKGGKKSADVKEDLHNLGYHILQSTNDAELVSKGRNAEQEHDNKYPNQLIQETKKRIASEYVKSIGGEDYVANKGSLSIEEADKFIDQLPQKYKKAYLEKIRPYAINQNGITSSISDVNDINFNPSLYTNKELSPKDASIELPNLGGAVNKFIQSYTQQIEGVFNFALDRLDSDGKVNRALEKPKMYEQELAKSKELKDQINQLKAKPKLTVQEATELSQKQQELQAQKPFKEVVDGSFSLLGQVVGQAAMSEIGTPFVSTALKGVNFGTKAVGFTDKASRIAEYASEVKNIKGASASMVAYVSSYSDAEKEAINLGLDGWKKILYSNFVAGLNAGTERFFKDEKVLDAFNAEVSPLISDMVQNLSTRNLTDAVLSREIKTIITKTLPKFAKNMVVENQKEAIEELATQLGTSIAKGILAPDQFNIQEELDAMKQVWYETTIYGGITSFGAAVTETRNSNVSKKAMYELGSNNAEINKFIDVVNTQVSNGKMSQEDANDKIKAVNTMQQIVQKSIPLIDSKRKLTQSEKVKLSNILLAERKLQDEIKNPNYSDVKNLNEKELGKVQDMKNKILNGDVFIDDNLGVYSQDEYNAKRNIEASGNIIIKYNNDGTLTILDNKGNFIEEFKGTIADYNLRNKENENAKKPTETPITEGANVGQPKIYEYEGKKYEVTDNLIVEVGTDLAKPLDFKQEVESKGTLIEQQPNVGQPIENELGLKDGDKYTDAKGVERIWGQDVNADKTHEIEQVLKATAEGASMGATIQSVEDFKAGKETIFRKPQSIEAAKNNPNYNVEIQDDGSAKVIGVLDPRNNEWVGKSPSTQSGNNSNVTIDNIDELLKNDVARLQISSDGNKVDFNMFDVVIDRENNTAEVSFIEKKNRDENKGVGVLAYIELAKKLNEQGISLVTSGNNPKMIGGDAIWNKLTKLGLTERYGNKGNKINVDKISEQQPTTSNQSEIDARNEIQSIQTKIDELIAQRKAEYDNALVGKENLSQTVKDNLNKKVSARYNPQIEELQSQLKTKQDAIEKIDKKEQGSVGGDMVATAKAITEKLSKQQNDLIQSIYDKYEGEEASKKIKELFASKEYKDIEEQINQLNPVGADFSGFEKTLSESDANDYAKYREIGYRLVAADKENGYKPFKVSEAEKKQYVELKKKFDSKFADYKKQVDTENIKTKQKALEQYLQETSQAGSVVGVDKSDADIEKRMAELEGAKIGTPELAEFNALEKEMEKRERDTVFNVPLENVNDAVDALMKKEKEQPNGFGSFIEKRDARETKEVADRYLNAKELTDAELKQDFSDAIRGNPTTWYADGLKMREALKEATNRGIDTKDMLAEVIKVYEDAGYDIETAKSVVAGMLKPIFEGSQNVNEKQAVEQSLKETPQAGSVGVGGSVEIETLNPTGSIFVNYSAEQRDKMPLGKNITTYDKTAGLSPDKKIIVYRGVSKDINEIQSGDFVTTNKQLAQDYAGDGKVISKEVRADEILDDKTEPLGEEYILKQPSLKETTKEETTKEETPKEKTKKEEVVKPIDEGKNVEEHKKDIQDKFRKEFKSKGISDEQIDGALALLEARAKSWASEEKGRNADEYYQKIADVKSGEFEIKEENNISEIVNKVKADLPKIEKKETAKEQPKTESEIPTWVAEFERTKNENDLVKMEELYNKIKVVQNGVLQGRIKDPIILEKTVKELNDLKKQIEDYAENWKKENQPKVSAVTETDTKKQPINKIEDLQDVGEKIGGAKKDLAQKLSEVTTDDLATKPLSKVFPKPDFKKLVEEGSLSEDGAILLNFLYEKIPAKPRKQYRVANWVKTVDGALQTTRQVLEAESTKNLDFTDKILKAVTLSETLKRDYKLYSDTMKGLGFPKNDVNLGGYQIKIFKRGNFSKDLKGGESVSDDVYSIVNGSSIIGDFKTMEDAVNGLKTILNKSKEKTKGTKFDVYQDKKTKEFFIGKKGAIDVVRVMQGFKTLGEARNFLKEKQADIQGLWDAMKAPKERRMANRPRVGTDWRKGKNVDSKEFADTFGFRGVEFGNWVNNAERQSHVNEAYDALMDLSSVLGISPKTLSLNGELGFAFGARGSGKANAHYEAGKVVINLTKTRGAGSLAHEWWHAMDNYFSRNRGQKESFITQSPRDRIERDGSRNQGVRKEMIDAFKSVMDAIEGTKLSERSKVLDRARSDAYWSTNIEMSARSFENYIIEKLGVRNQQNDYLANFKETAEWINDTKGDIDALKNYPYPLAEESPIVNEKFQQFFETIKEDENSKLFQDNKGAVETLADGRKVIHALDAPDFSTMVHEIGHVFESDLTEEEQKTVKDFGGSEAFARGFEKYLRDGKAPTTELKTLFDKFKEWLTDIYKTLKGSPIEKRVTPEIKQIFDRLLTDQSLKETPKAEEGSVGVGGDAGTSLRGVKYSDIIVDDKYLEDILSDNKLSEDEKRQVREVFARGVDYFKFDKEGEQKFQEKFANPEDITDVADIITGLSAAQQSAFNFYNTKNYENVKDAVNYIANNPNEYSPKVIKAVKEIKEKLDNPSSSMSRLYAIDVMKELGISEQSLKEKVKEIELKRDSDVRELSKYRIKINLPTMKEIVNSKDPIGNKWKYSAIKEKITMLDKLINCL